MSFKICTDGTITSNGTGTHLHVKQTATGTVVYSEIGGTYREHPMPHNRYNLTTDVNLNPGVAGMTQFGEDIDSGFVYGND